MRSRKASSIWAGPPDRTVRARARSCSRSCRTARASGVAGERAVGAQVAERGRSLPEVLVETREVVVRVGAMRVGGDRELVRGDGLRAAPQVFEGDPEVERGGAVVGARLQGTAVGGGRGGRPARPGGEPSRGSVRL